jgi:hypothetical protein
MIEALLHAMIGDWGLEVIDWAMKNPGWIFAGLGAWLVMFGLGKLQLKSIRDKTETWVLDSSNQIVAESPGISIQNLYERLYPDWVTNLRGSAIFILHRWEIWPVPATPRFVKDRIEFTPEWLGGFLWANGLKVKGGQAPEAKAITPKVKTPRRNRKDDALD